jgi:hypothetical protein
MIRTTIMLDDKVSAKIRIFKLKKLKTQGGVFLFLPAVISNIGEGIKMRSEKEIKEAQETIKDQLTRVDTELGRINLQGQYAALDWVITLDEVKSTSGGEQQ